MASKANTEIKFDTNNYRKHNDKNKALIRKSLKECGAGRSIITDKEGEIIAGNGVYEQAKALNIPVKIVETDGSELVVVKRTDLATQDEKRKKLALMDNSTSDQVEWDFKNLALDFNLNELGEFGIENIAEVEVEPSEIVQDEVPEIPDVAPKVKRGEIYQLGNHRLMCGDSTDKSDVERLMAGQKADLLLTDPPYNVNVSNSQGMRIENDNMAKSAFEGFLNDAFSNASEFLIPGGAFYVWHGDNARVTFQQALENNKLTVKQCLIWVKNGFTLCRQDYKWAHEPCLYGWKEGDSHYFIKEFNHATVIEDKVDIKKLKKEELLALVEKLIDPKEVATTVMRADKPLKNDLHPTMKPNKLIAEQIRNSSRLGENVLDLFGGSGTTLICAEQLHRNSFTMEYDPRYADVIIERWENLTGKKAVKCK